MTNLKPVQTVIDGVNLNARHFAGMSKDAAVKAMELDGILHTHSKDAAWAGKAHDTMVADVKKADTPPPAPAKPATSL